MPLERLHISNVRNLRQVVLENLGLINLFFGENGSGKTSLLEAIHILGLGRSFRNAQLNPVIQYKENHCTVFGGVLDSAGVRLPTGISRFRDGEQNVRINGQGVDRLSVLAANLPLQVIDADAFELLSGGPGRRRHFMDWGAFHVEHQFLEHWQRVQRCLRQRNSLLRRGKMKRYAELDEWDAVLIESAGQVDAFRKSYVDAFAPVFRDTLDRLISLEDVQATYSRGWPQEEHYGQALEQSFQRDAERGVTHIGPHRADLRLRVGGREAESSLSRGQQKLVVCAMRVAQGILLARASGKTCIFLVDDLPSELDEKHRRRLSELLEQVGHQVFVTGVDKDALRVGWSGKDIKMFHVEHGEVTEIFEGASLADSSLISERQATQSPY